MFVDDILFRHPK